MVPRSFLRWAGSKRYLLKFMVPYMPNKYGTYYEPFLGSGALFFLLGPSAAILNDSCHDLIETYKAVRDGSGAVLRYLAPMRLNERTYYKVRSQNARSRFQRAANFVYLNHACWNGLYRVNSRGEFNVPFGRPKTPNLPDADNLVSCGRLLRQSGVKLVAGDFEQATKTAKKGDLVYFDPPYVTKHNHNGFRDYNESLFRWSDQERLADLAENLSDAGVVVLVSNANHTEISKMYPSFRPIVIDRKSTLAGKSTFRGRVSEVMLVPRWVGSARRRT
jgi:DNA adenine methylase